jgi:hypothetical protein
MNNPDILKDYVCLQPFKYLDVQDNSQWVCCPSWAPTNIRTHDDGTPLYQKDYSEEDLMHNWQGPIASSIRTSVMDGSYSHCNHKVCPDLSQIINTGIVPKNFIKKEKFQKMLANGFKPEPEEVLFGFDRSCNLKCPSCRSEQVPNDDAESKDFQHKLFLLSQIENQFSNSIKRLSITGSGDPFYSKLYRDYLINFDPSKYPNLENIHIITNGVLLTEKMWNSLNSKQYITSIEVSIDAGCKETYENITRLNGDWDKLLSNLKFLSTQSTIKSFCCSMVVSQYNYKEMKLFYDTIQAIFKDSSIHLYMNFRQIIHWQMGAYSIKDISTISVFEPEHPEHTEFLKELNLISKLPNINHNFHHLLNHDKD